MPKWIWDIILAMVVQASPEIKKQVCEKLDELAAKAKETKNPIDDLLVGMLKGMVGCHAD